MNPTARPAAAQIGRPVTTRTRPRWNLDRWSFTAAIAVYGGAIGGLAVLANLLGRTPGFLEPVRLDAPEGLFVYGSGVVAGAVVAAPIAYWGHGGYESVAMGHRGLGLAQWALLSVAYAMFFPLLLGGLFLPFALMLLSVYLGVIDPGGVLYASADTLILAPLRGFSAGAPFIFSSLWTSVLFGVGAALMDRASTNRRFHARQALWVVSLTLSLFILIFATFAPATFLARFG
jgi:hypothetical protein